jgi:hypothetical protein
MVDKPVILRAERILNLAYAAGILNKEEASE